jgi:hypothetical protein
MHLWFASGAFAGPSVTVVENDGMVRASVVVGAPYAEVLAMVRDPSETAAMSPEGTFQVAPAAAGCFDIEFTARTWLASVWHRSLSCPTSSGMRMSLVESDTFRALSSEWAVRSLSTGTEVSYTYRADLAVPVPAWIVRRATREAIVDLMLRVAARFDTG